MNLIWAQDLDGGIGKNNQLPWSIPEEMKHFRDTTKGSTVVMGRKTFESIGRPLPKRHNIVITTDPNWTHEGVEVFHDIPSFLEKYRSHAHLYVIGGKTIYEQLMPYAKKLIVSIIKDHYQCDTFMKPVDLNNFVLENTRPYEMFNVLHYKKI